MKIHENEKVLNEVTYDLRDGYDGISPLDSGGMGLLFVGHKKGLDVPVVIKRVKGKYKGKMNERSEADILKKLKHRYLPTIYDVIESESGFVYTIMDYVPGDNLKQYVKGHGPVSQKWAYRWACQLCEVVDYLHQQKPAIIHSDIKPSNVMITPVGDICLIDFNISLVMQDGLTAIGKTQGYAAPEQYTRPEELMTFFQPAAEPGEAVTLPDADQTVTESAGATDQLSAVAATGSVSAISSMASSSAVSSAASFTAGVTLRAGGFGGLTKRTDVYSIGATLYFAVTGQTPPHALAEPVPLSTLKHGLSPAFVSVIERAMQIQPKDRYDDAGIMGSALADIHIMDRRYKQSLVVAVAVTVAVIVLTAAGILLVMQGSRRIQLDHNKDFSAAVLDAQNLRNEGDYEAALRKLEEARRIHDDRLESYAEEAILLFYQGRYDDCVDKVKAVSVAKLICEDESEWANMYYYAAESAIALERYAEAETWSRMALERQPGAAAPYSSLASALYRQGRKEEVQQVLDEMRKNVEEDRELGIYYMLQAQLYSAAGQDQEALRSYLEAIDRVSDTMKPRAYQEAALLCSSAGMRAEGYDLLSKAAADESLSEGTRNVFRVMLAETCRVLAGLDPENREDHYREALAQYQLCVEYSPANISMKLNVAELQKVLKDYAAAEVTLKEVIAAAPEDYRGYRDLTELYILKGYETGSFDIQNIRENYALATAYYSGDWDDLMLELSALVSTIF